MKFERLRPNKIKVLIEAEDLAKWGVSADAVAKNSPETREMFVALFKQAEEETGFVCNNSRLVIEAAMSSADRNITLFVTKVDSDEEKALFDRVSAARNAENLRINLSPRRKNTLIELESFEDVIKLCYAISSYFGGTLYSYEDKYYMCVEQAYANAASEFGKVKSVRSQTIIEEHGVLVVRNNAFAVIRSKFHE